MGCDDRPGGLSHNGLTVQVEGEAEEVFLETQNPRTELSAVSSLTEPSHEREAKLPTTHWAAVTNPRMTGRHFISVQLPPRITNRGALRRFCGRPLLVSEMHPGGQLQRSRLTRLPIDLARPHPSDRHE